MATKQTAIPPTQTTTPTLTTGKSTPDHTPPPTARVPLPHMHQPPRLGLSHSLLALQRTIGNHSVARLLATRHHRPSATLDRSVDTSKAEPIRKELNSTVYVSNAKLEELWASLGTSLPEAINDPVYRDLWWQSVTKEKISLTEAGKPLIKAFATDTVSVARGHVSSQSTRLENLVKELEEAKKQPQASATQNQSTTGGIEDADKAMSRSTLPKPFAHIGDLIDTATLAHFLQNWEDILKTAPIGARHVDQTHLLNPPGSPPVAAPFNPFPNSPASQAAAAQQANGGPAQTAEESLAPLLFDPSVSMDQLLAAPNIAYIDHMALEAIQKTYQQCVEQRSVFKELYRSLLAEDANLAVLAERGLLAQVSALGIHTDDQASAALSGIAKENAEAAKRFLDMLVTPGTVDWKALRPVHAHLLSGGGGGSMDWSHITARGFIEDYFKKQAEAERDRAQAEMIAQLALTATTFVALLTPASPLAAAFLLASDAMAVAGAVSQSLAADKKADVLSAGAAAQVVDKADARQAREEADAKHASMVVDVLMTALPYLPGIAKGGAKAVRAMGGELRLEKLATYATRLGAGPQVGDFVLDLAKTGISAVARNRAGGVLSLSEIMRRIPTISRTLPWVQVAKALARGGDESLLHLGSKYGLSNYIRYHIHGPGTGLEGFPIFLAPERSNQFANNAIEGFMRRERDAGALVEFSASFTTFNGSELRPFIEGMLKSGDKQIINRLALDQGLIEKFLQSISYDIRVTRGGQATRYRASITIGAPPIGAVTTIAPTRIP